MSFLGSIYDRAKWKSLCTVDKICFVYVGKTMLKTPWSVCTWYWGLLDWIYLNDFLNSSRRRYKQGWNKSSAHLICVEHSSKTPGHFLLESQTPLKFSLNASCGHRGEGLKNEKNTSLDFKPLPSVLISVSWPFSQKVQ